VIALALARAAAAEPNAADATFQRGRDLMEQKQYAAACDAFEQSQRLDPEPGTLFNLADCEVQLGKLATAWAHYRELERNDTNEERRQASAQLAAQLAPRVPKLVIVVPPKPAKLHVQLDGTDVTALVGVQIPIDLGDHAVAAGAPGFRDASATAQIHDEGKVVRVTLRLDPLDAGEAPAEQPAMAAPATNLRRRIGIIGTWSGAGTAVAGLVVGTFAWTTWHRATNCNDASCDRVSLSHDARVLGDVSTALVVVGLAAAGAGVYLWKTSESAAQVVPDRAGVAIVGRF
jgi:hypothetical protein